MRKLALLCIILLSAPSAFAFPLTDIIFNCPNTYARTVLRIPLQFNPTTNTWTGELIEKDISVGPVNATYNEDQQRMEVSMNNRVIGLMTQTDSHASIYRDGNFVLTCSF
jgi:hypothetical protein